MESIVFQINIC